MQSLFCVYIYIVCVFFYSFSLIILWFIQFGSDKILFYSFSALMCVCVSILF